MPRPLSPRPDVRPQATLDPISAPLRSAAHAAPSARALATAAGVDIRTVIRWMRGSKDITLATADRLAVALRLRLADATTRRGSSASASTRPGPTPLQHPLPITPDDDTDSPGI